MTNSKYRLEHRIPRDEYVGHWGNQVKSFFKEMGFMKQWNVVENETGEVIGGASTRERAINVIKSLKGGKDAF